MVFLFLFAIYVLWRHIQDAVLISHRGKYPAVLLRIMTNHIQILGLVQSLRLEWPEFVLKYYDIQTRIGSSTQLALNLDCLVDRNSIKPVYANLISLAILPIGLMLLTILIWTMIKLFRKKMSWINYVHYTRGTIINILFLVYPTILKV